MLCYTCFSLLVVEYPRGYGGDRLRANCRPLPKPNTAQGAVSASSRIHTAGATAAGLLYPVENRVLVICTRTQGTLTRYKATVIEKGHTKTVDLAELTWAAQKAGLRQRRTTLPRAGQAPMLLNCREFNHPSVANVYVSYIRRVGSDTARGLSRTACRERLHNKTS